MRRGFARGRLLRGNVGEPFGAEDVEAYAAPLSGPLPRPRHARRSTAATSPPSSPRCKGAAPRRRG